MKHFRWIPPDARPQVPVDPEDPRAGERDATKQELRQMDMELLGKHPDGGWVFDCLGREGREYPGYEIAGRGPGRFKTADPATRQVAWRQRVIRAAGSLRSELRLQAGRETEDGPPVSARGRGREPAVEHRRLDPSDVVDEARRRAEDPETDARRMRLPLTEVDDEDVVEARPEPGHGWSGEPDRGEMGPGNRPRPRRRGRS